MNIFTQKILDEASQDEPLSREEIVTLLSLDSGTEAVEPLYRAGRGSSFQQQPGNGLGGHRGELPALPNELPVLLLWRGLGNPWYREGRRDSLSLTSYPEQR
jgi:hypothetical protein